MYKEFIVAYKSPKTNSFGLHQYILVSRTGTAYKVLKTLCFPLHQHEVVSVPVDERGWELWARLGFECPDDISPLKDQRGLKELWERAKVAA